MNAKKRRQRSSLVFAWEARSSSLLSRALRLLSPMLVLLIFVLSAFALSRVERSRADERQRLADAWHVRQLVDRYRVAHDGGCPTTMPQLVSEGAAWSLSVDAGAFALQNFCPTDVQAVSLSSYEKGFAEARAHGPLE